MAGGAGGPIRESAGGMTGGREIWGGTIAIGRTGGRTGGGAEGIGGGVAGTGETEGGTLGGAVPIDRPTEVSSSASSTERRPRFRGC
jgi:hypothetical protein